MSLQSHALLTRVSDFSYNRLQAHLDPETGQWVVGGMGDLHLEVIMARLKREYKVDANMGPLLIAYKECPVPPSLTGIPVFEGRGYSVGVVDGRERAFLVDVSIEASGKKTPQVSLASPLPFASPIRSFLSQVMMIVSVS